MQARVEQHNARGAELQREVERLRGSLATYRSGQAQLIEAAAADGVQLPFVDEVDADRLMGLEEEASEVRFPDIDFA